MSERFGAPTPLQRVDTRTGAAAGLSSVADRLEQFQSGLERLAIQKFKERAVERGRQTASQVELERVAGVTQKPEFKQVPLFFGQEEQSHNEVLRAAYVASIRNDNREALARISNENPEDVLKFNDAAASYRAGVLQGIDPAIRGIVSEDIDNKITSSRIQIHGNEIRKQREEATAQLDISAQAASDEAMVLARRGDLVGSAEKLQEFFTINSQYLTESEQQIKRRDVEFRATKETIVGGINKMVEDGDFNNAVEAIIKFREKVPRGFTLEEHDEVITAMTSEVNESISLQNKLEDVEADALKNGQETRFVELFSGIARGEIESKDVLAALNNKKITVEQATKLTNTLNTRGKGVDDWGLVTTIQDDIRRGVNVRSAIIANTGTNLTEATAASLLAENDQARDEQSRLQTNNFRRAEGFVVQSMRVTGPFGALDTEAERRLANARRELGERVLAGEDPWKVADRLVGKDDFERAPAPIFGNKQNLEGSLELLNNAILLNQIDDDTYNFEFEKLERLIQLRDNIEAFNKSRKEADSAVR